MRLLHVTICKWKRKQANRLLTFTTTSLNLITIVGGTWDLRITVGGLSMTKCWHRLIKLICNLAQSQNLSITLERSEQQKHKRRSERKRLNGYASYIEMLKTQKSWLNKAMASIQPPLNQSISKSNSSTFTKIPSTIWSSRRWTTANLTRMLTG